MSQNTNECISLREERARRENRARIPVKCAQRNRFIPGFLIGVVVLSVISLLYLQIDWLKLASRVPDIGEVFWELAHLDFANMDLIWSALIETISIAVLSLLYSLLLGIVFGMLAARNVFRIPVLSVLTQSFFTFLRAVPTPGVGAAHAGVPRHGAGGGRCGPVRAHDCVFHQILCAEL